MTDVTRILSAIQQGDPHAAAQLLPLVYDELRKLAAAKMAQEKPGQTLEATALVHEAYLRLVEGERRGSSPPWDSRRHFFAAAAEAMRRILVEQARRRKAVKRGGGAEREALGRLAAEDAVAARVVELRQFAGLGHEQIAGVLGITVYQARAYAQRRSADRAPTPRTSAAWGIDSPAK